MKINFLKLLEYFKERLETTIEMDLNDEEPTLMFTKGHWSEYGGVTIYLSLAELREIILINKVEKQFKEIDGDTELREMTNPAIYYDTIAKKKDDVLYDTLAKYVLQMLSAALGKILYPEIIPLEIHKRDYFRNVG